MKSITRITLAAALVLTAASSSLHVSASPTAKIAAVPNKALPTPMCAPDDPNACGMARGRR
jgi:hypothetical protein